MSKLTKLINWPVFIGSFLLGLIFVHLSSEPSEKILVYPTPINAGHIQYEDKAGVCYVYKTIDVNCPKKGVKNIPIQE
uniref:Uncharacterized protein n=1 Tax=viral metagenome TaxID=1070528 RepID=A0A6C0CPF1_9ZZZZ